LLGRPWQKGVKLGKIEHADGSIEVEISDPGEEGRRVRVPTKERVGDRFKNGMLVVRSKDGGEQAIKGGEDSLMEAILVLSFTYDGVAQCLVYKKVVVKICPVPGTMPPGMRIVRQFLEDPLETLPAISPHPPLFVPGICLTKQRMESIRLLSNEFL